MPHAYRARGSPRLSASGPIPRPQGTQLPYVKRSSLYQASSRSNQPRMPTMPGWQMPPSAVPPPPPCMNTPPPTTLRIAVPAPVVTYPQPPPGMVAFAHPPPQLNYYAAPVPIFGQNVAVPPPGIPAQPVTAFPVNPVLPQFVPPIRERRRRMPLAIVDPNPGKAALQLKKKEMIEPNTNVVSTSQGSEVKQSTEDEKQLEEAEVKDPLTSPTISKAILEVPLAKLKILSVKQDSEPPRIESVATTAENGTKETEETWNLFEQELEDELSASNAAETETKVLFRKRSSNSLKRISFECPPSPVKIAPLAFESKTKHSNSSLGQTGASRIRFGSGSGSKVPDRTRKSFASIANAPPNERLDLQKLPETTAQLRILPRPRSQDSLASSSERSEASKSCPTEMNGMQITKRVYSLQEHLVVAADDNLEFLYENAGQMLISIADYI